MNHSQQSFEFRGRAVRRSTSMCFKKAPLPLEALHKDVILAARRVRQRPCSPPRLADLVQKRPARGNQWNSFHSPTPTPLRTNSQKWDFWLGKDLKHSSPEAPPRHVLEPRLLPLPPALEPCPFATPPPSCGRRAKRYRKPFFVQSPPRGEGGQSWAFPEDLPHP